MSGNARNDDIFNRRGRDRSTNDNRNRDRSPLNRSNRQQRDDCRVFVSNLPYEFRWQDVKSLFRREVGDVSFVELFTDENDKSKGSGIVEFDSPDDAKKAIDKLHRYEVEGRKIVVKEDYGAPRDKYGNLLRNRGDGRHDDKRNSGPPHRDVGPVNNSDWGETYGLSRSFLEGLNISPPLGCRVFVANLDYKVTEKKLREVFKLAGKVRDVELQTDAEGKSRGFAIVEYDHPVESVQSISMLHNQMLYDRRLTVRLDRDTIKESSRLPEGLHSIGMGLGQNGAPLREVARNLPNSNATQQSSLPSLTTQNSLSALTAAAAMSNPLTAAAIGGLTGPSAAALQAAAMLAPGNAGLLGSGGGLNSLTGNRSDSISRDLPFASLAGLGSNNLLNDNSSSVMHSLNSSRDNYNDRNNSPARNPIPKTSDTVIVDNLPHNFTWQELKEQFRDAGEIKFAEMRGKLGLVRFASDWEALRAVSLLDRTRVDGQSIDVRLF